MRIYVIYSDSSDCFYKFSVTTGVSLTSVADISDAHLFSSVGLADIYCDIFNKELGIENYAKVRTYRLIEEK